jgi:hypothetical protein
MSYISHQILRFLSQFTASYQPDKKDHEPWIIYVANLEVKVSITLWELKRFYLFLEISL